MRDGLRHYDALFEQSAISIAQLDSRTGRFLRVNRQYSEMLGYTRDELLALDFQTITHGEDLQADLDNMERLRTGEISTFQMEKRLIRKDGQVVWVRLAVVPLWIPGEPPDFHLAFVEDITDRKRTEMSLHLTQYGLDRAVDGFFWIEPSGKIIYVNHAACRLLAYDRSELIGKTVAEIDPNFPAEAWPAHWEELRQRGSFTFESDHLTKDGRTLKTEVTVNYIRHEGREYNFAVMRDITERKRIEDQLLTSEHRFREIAATINDVFWMADPNLEQTLYISPAYERVWGRSCASLYANPASFLDAIHPDDRQRMLENLRVRAHDQPFEYHYRVIRPSGEVRWVWDQGFPVLDQQGGVRHYIGVAKDITEQKQNEAERHLATLELRRSEERFSKLFQASPFLILLATYPDGKIVEANEAFCRLSGFEREDIIGRSTLEIQLWHNLADRQAMIEQLRQNSSIRNAEYTFLTKTGSPRTLLMSVELVQFEGQTHTLSMAFDISDWRRTQKELATSQERYSLVVRGVNDGVWDWDLRTNDEYHSPRWCQILGYRDGELPNTSNTFSDLVHPADREKIDAALRRHFQAGERYEVEIRLRHKDGDYRWVLTRGEAVRDAAGQPVRMVGSISDITPRKQAEEALRDSEALYRTLFESCPDSVFLLDSTGRIRAANSATMRMHGYSLSELQEMRIWELNDAEGARLAPGRLQRLQQGKPVHFETIHRRKDGTTFPVEVVGTPLRLAGEWFVLSFDRDISERKRNEEQAALLRDELAHVARLTTMGEMTAGLSHELNQPLAALHLYSSTARLLDPVADAAQFRELLNLISQQSLRAGQIVHRMRAFVASPRSRRSSVNVNQLIQEVLSLLAVDLRHAGAMVEAQLVDDLPLVLADGIQIQQVMVNLIRNALDALESTPVGQRRLTIRSRLDGVEARVSVSDNGCGIDPSIADKIFQPFQTTKATGHGLGLAICRNLIEAHEGRIGVEPGSSLGTTFFFTIPLGGNSAKSVTSAVNAADGQQPNGGGLA
ncbi:MAG: PAS domain S-box protein [Pirellulaceae bacterium]|nr:PAS domain S-box protein [Pirellulaceae bacterium]